MLRIPDRPLAPAAQLKLAEYQRDIDALAGFAERVETGKSRFTSRNREGDPAFGPVRQTLKEMCSGVLRCMYCEDSLADQVEHFNPKDFYPELVFAWHNYLYSCGPCNRRKNNKFPIFSDRTGAIVILSRAPRAPVVPPEAGAPALIDPRHEDPFDYMQLDLQDTFRFLPLDPDAGSAGHQRARQTIDVLGLNDREFLPEARESAFRGYLSLLSLYVECRDAVNPCQDPTLLVRALRRYHHATVWAEMKRQRNQLPQLQTLFAQAPEALGW
jgi:uncharacterized protein (TIGR02646 family)